MCFLAVSPSCILTKRPVLTARLRTDPDALGRWLRACDAKHVLVHFDMDVLDPAEIIPAVGVSPDGMKLAEVVRAIRLERMLEQLPLLGTPSC